MGRSYKRQIPDARPVEGHVRESVGILLAAPMRTLIWAVRLTLVMGLRK